MEAVGHGVDQQGNPWWSRPVTSSSAPLYRLEYPTSAKEAEIKGTAFSDLLYRKVREAEKALAADLEQQLFYGSSKRVKPNPELRKAIGDAYDATMASYMDKLTDNVFRESPIMEHLKKKEKEMGAVDKIVAEREEARARAVFDKLDLMWEDMGDLVSFDVKFDANGKTYNYAARLGGDGLWYITGKDTFGRRGEEFKAYLAELAVRAHEMSLEGEWL